MLGSPNYLDGNLVFCPKYLIADIRGEWSCLVNSPWGVLPISLLEKLGTDGECNTVQTQPTETKHPQYLLLI